MYNEKSLIIRSVITGSDGTFTQKDEEKLLEQLEGHKYFLDRQLGLDLPFEKVALSWMETVFLPINNEMNSLLTMISFSKKERNELFFEISEHQLLLSLDRNKNVEAYEAVRSYCEKYGSGLGKFFSKFAKKIA